jgi:preprotein translocase subunit SecA
MKLFSKIFGSSNSRKLKKLKRSVTQISVLEEGFKGLSDDQLKAKTVEFQERIAGGESVCGCARGEHQGVRHAPFRRSVDRRHGA